MKSIEGLPSPPLVNSTLGSSRLSFLGVYTVLQLSPLTLRLWVTPTLPQSSGCECYGKPEESDVITGGSMLEEETDIRGVSGEYITNGNGETKNTRPTG